MFILSRSLCPAFRVSKHERIVSGASRVGLILAPAQPDRHCSRVDFLNNAEAPLPFFGARHASKERLAVHPVVVLAVLAVPNRVAEREAVLTETSLDVKLIAFRLIGSISSELTASTSIKQVVDFLFGIGAVNPQTRRDVLSVSADLEGPSVELIMDDQKTAGTVFVRRLVEGGSRGDLECRATRRHSGRTPPIWSSSPHEADTEKPLYTLLS